jgi:hypothetical protein
MDIHNDLENGEEKMTVNFSTRSIANLYAAKTNTSKQSNAQTQKFQSSRLQSPQAKQKLSFGSNQYWDAGSLMAGILAIFVAMSVFAKAEDCNKSRSKTTPITEHMPKTTTPLKTISAAGARAVEEIGAAGAKAAKSSLK